MRIAICLLALAVSACGTSHRTGDAGSGTGCEGPAPTGCTTPGPGSCCMQVDAICRGGEWRCDPPGTFCEGPCGSEVCGSVPPLCVQDLGDGCCGDAVEPECFTPFWSCPPGSLERSSCAAFEPACGGVCDDLSEAACIGSPECAPLYDDVCCPTCTEGGCADCQRPEMYRCAPLAEACAPEPPCAISTPWTCRPSALVCDDAVPVISGRCSVAGCVTAVDSACTEDCELTCVAVTGESCTASCDVPAPPCLLDYVPEGDGGCYTGRCIHASACTPGA